MNKQHLFDTIALINSSLAHVIWGEGDELEDLFRRSRDIRRRIVDAGQA